MLKLVSTVDKYYFIDSKMKSCCSVVTLLIVAQMELHKYSGKSRITTKKRNSKMKITIESHVIPEYPKNQNCNETFTYYRGTLISLYSHILRNSQRLTLKGVLIRLLMA